jgi:CubicO group peptidase (beta-lactamase class C family)
MNKLLVLLILPALACQARSNQADIDARIAQLEGEIVSGIQIQGEPVNTATLEERMAHHGVPAVSIAVLNDGKIEWARAYGMADVETGRLATPSTLFQAASISKPVAATAALTLVEDGVLALDQDVNDLLDMITS